MKLTSMQKIIAVAVAIAAAAVVVFFFLIFPMFGQLSELDSKQQSADALVQQSQTTLKQLQEAKAKASETQAQLVRVSNEVPENPELPTLIIELQDICNVSGVRFVSIAPKDPVYRGGDSDVPEDINFTDVPVDMVVEGTWTDFLDLLRRLNGMTRAIRVTDVSIQGPTALPSSVSPTATIVEPMHPLLRVTMSIKAFVMGNMGVLVGSSSAASGTAPPAGATP
jgi:type IV pilus assembly protein PilO